jgi:hypothetical protein
MNTPGSSLYFTLRGAWGRLLAALMGLALLALAACNGTAVVTMTSTASTDNFLAYRVGLVSVQLQGSGGKSGLTVLPASTTVDFATLTDVSEVLGASPVSKGTYTSALVTLDYSSTQIVYDNGSLNGVTLTPVGANGKALGQVQITVTLDPSNSFSVSSKGASQLAMDFNMAASNVVDLSNNTVMVTPMIAASALPIDSKLVRIRGPLVNVAAISAATAISTSFTMDAAPFNSTTSGKGPLLIVPSDTATYEINGTESTGSAGLGQLAALGTGSLAVAYGTLTAADQTTTSYAATTTYGTANTTTTSSVTFSATQILGGSSVQGAGLDRVSGTVSARSGNTITVEDGTLVGADGSESFIGGTTAIIMGPNTLITVFGQDGSEINSLQQVSVGSSIDAFGVLTGQSSDNATLDASAGHVRLDNTTASGVVTAQGSNILNLNLSFLGGRTVAALDFNGSGASANPYVVNTATGNTAITGSTAIGSTAIGNTATGYTATGYTTTGPLDLSNATAGAPVIVTGQTSSFGTPQPNFTALTLLDPTTIQAELVVDWGTGTPSPFTTYNSTAIDLDVRNSSIGVRHEIQIGAQLINIVALTSDPLISPNATASASVFAIGHAASSTIENFNTYAAFIAQLQTELNGSTLATGMTATGQYTASSSSFVATSITLFLNK